MSLAVIQYSGFRIQAEWTYKYVEQGKIGNILWKLRVSLAVIQALEYKQSGHTNSEGKNFIIYCENYMCP